MISAVLDHLWQSTLVAFAAAVLALAFRGGPAAVRYGLWFTASAKFLVPFAALGALGRLLAPAIRPPAAVTSDAALIARAAEPFSPALPATHLAIPFDPTLLLVVVWALGSVGVLAFWLARWTTVRAALRHAAPLALPAPMPVLASSWMREPGLVGLWRPVLLVPETLFEHLDRPTIDALVAHEACHLRRRDNLTAAIHMLVEALFWFHPFVWWIGGRLVHERERACDEAVVDAGHDREAYARGLIECCRLYLQSPLQCVAGASGSNLMQRVESIMTAPLRTPLSAPGRIFLFAMGACALASPVAAGWLTSPQGREAVARVAALASAPGAVSAAPSAVMPEHRTPVKAVRAAQNDLVSAPAGLASDDGGARAAEPDRPSPDAVEPSAPVAIEPTSSPALMRAPAPDIEVSHASLTPVSAPAWSPGSAPLGPGHYVQSSGRKASGGCRYDERELPMYRMSTPPIAPGHVITNFRFDLVGDTRCAVKWPTYTPSAYCELRVDKPDRKTVWFRLYNNKDQCFDGARPAPRYDESIRRAEMVISYDVR